jgi:TIR domain
MNPKLLSDLLLSMFSADELRRLVRYNWPALSPNLPGPTASPAALVEALLVQLEHEKMIDAAFFTTLRNERPRRIAEIDGVARVVAGGAAPLATPTARPTATPPTVPTGTTASATPTAFPYDVFLAHAGPDLPIAVRLYDQLIAHPDGLRVFLDARTLELGQAWDIELPKALRRSRLIVVLVSQRIEAAWYAREEVALAIELARKPDAAQRVIPVFIDGNPTENVPYGLRIIHGLSLPDVTVEGAARKLAELAIRLRAA